MKKKILVIDDEEDFLTITKLNLEATGIYEVMTLADPKDVVDIVHTFKPDLILLDMIMPSMSGAEVCDLLNKDTENKTIPVIIVSALDRKSDKTNVFMKGVVGYLVKPIDRKEFLAKIELALQ